MNLQKRLLVVEVKTIDNPGLDRSQLSTITAFSNLGQLYLSEDSGLEFIKSAIIEAVIHLGSNYRHPLLFNVQIVPGDELDAFFHGFGRSHF